MASQESQPRNVEEIFQDFCGRRTGLIRALTQDVEEFFTLCDPAKESLCLFTQPNESWEVIVPVKLVELNFPKPILGINLVRDKMDRNKWLSNVALLSDWWLLSVAFYEAGLINLNHTGRERLFSLINNRPTVFEVVTGKIPIDGSGSGSGSKSKDRTKRSGDGEVKSNPKSEADEDEKENNEDEDEEENNEEENNEDEKNEDEKNEDEDEEKKNEEEKNEDENNEDEKNEDEKNEDEKNEDENNEEENNEDEKNEDEKNEEEKNENEDEKENDEDEKNDEDEEENNEDENNEDEDDEEDHKVYKKCELCDGNVDGYQHSIECKICGGWFHGRCAMITFGEVWRSDEYKCPTCSLHFKM